MDRISFIGIAVSLLAIIGGQLLEGGSPSSILQFTALLIVLGGTSGAVMLQSTPQIFIDGLRLARWVFQPPPNNRERQLRRIVDWSTAARRGGLLALEQQVDIEPDLFVRKGLQLLVDGAEPEQLRASMELELDTWERRKKLAAGVWESAGGYSPTVGILGAVLGLIHVMENLKDPGKLGSGIAVAFVATIYGVGSANLIFLPIAKKLKYWISEEVTSHEMYIAGLVCIAQGENPRMIEARLQAYI